MHPHQLHATNALWSLRRSWPHLDRAHRAAQAAATEDADRGTLQAWRPSTGGHGGSGDGFATAVLTSAAATTATRYDALVDRVRYEVEQARWLVAKQHDFEGAALPVIAAALPTVGADRARDIAAYLTAADQAIRRALQLLPDHWTLPGNPTCPACTVRMLRVVTSAPDTAAWTVVCTAPCRCTGNGCPCGMTEPAQGVPHVWDRDAPLVADALTAMPRRRIRSRSRR